MLLNRVAAKAHNAIQVVDDTNTTRPLKKLNFVWAGGKLQDAVAVTDPQAGFLVGQILTFPDNLIYIVAKITDDFYHTVQIRANLELVLCNNTVTISRQMPQSNNQGGISGHVDTIVYQDLPCKVINLDSSVDKLNDVNLNKYAVYIPITKPVEVGDKLQFAHSYGVSKVEGIKEPTLGLFELAFDRDLRW